MLTAPGFAVPEPPPTSAATLDVWCGATNGGSVINGRRAVKRPATECTAVTSSASSWRSGGSRPGKRCASIVFPIPGGPVNIRWCAPAAANSTAKRASAWPTTSAMSGASVTCRYSDCDTGSSSPSAHSHAVSWRNVRTPSTSIPSTSPASPRLACGCDRRPSVTLCRQYCR